MIALIQRSAASARIASSFTAGVQRLWVTALVAGLWN